MNQKSRACSVGVSLSCDDPGFTAARPEAVVKSGERSLMLLVVYQFSLPSFLLVFKKNLVFILFALPLEYFS